VVTALGHERRHMVSPVSSGSGLVREAPRPRVQAAEQGASEVRRPQILDCLFKSDRPGRFCCSPTEPGRKNLLPDLTPVRLTFTLALELSAGSSHASAALRAHAIQNAGYHIGIRLICTPFC
jgi:hypothetical protein